MWPFAKERPRPVDRYLTASGKCLIAHVRFKLDRYRHRLALAHGRSESILLYRFYCTIVEIFSWRLYNLNILGQSLCRHDQLAHDCHTPLVFAPLAVRKHCRDRMNKLRGSYIAAD